MKRYLLISILAIALIVWLFAIQGCGEPASFGTGVAAGVVLSEKLQEDFNKAVLALIEKTEEIEAAGGVPVPVLRPQTRESIGLLETYAKNPTFWLALISGFFGGKVHSARKKAVGEAVTK